jgi:hypothetical protein
LVPAVAIVIVYSPAIIQRERPAAGLDNQNETASDQVVVDGGGWSRTTFPAAGSMPKRISSTLRNEISVT